MGYKEDSIVTEVLEKCGGVSGHKGLEVKEVGCKWYVM